jgi:hypothetical protein
MSEFIFSLDNILVVDMNVLVYSNFSKRKIWKKMKSPSSMRNGRIHPPKCRGKVQKMGVLYIHSPKMPSPSPNFLTTPKKILKKTKKMKKRKRQGKQPTVCQTVGRSRWVTSGRSPPLYRCPKFLPAKIFLLPPNHLF